jgi:hypothetical protein
MKDFRHYFLSAWLLAFSLLTLGQSGQLTKGSISDEVADSDSGEAEFMLTSDPARALDAEREKRFAPRADRLNSLELPFFDDFSRYSFQTNDPSIPALWQRWEPSGAYLNSTFAINPPSIGVATLDGLMGNGYPYNFLNPFAYGPADTLTSLPINMGGLTAGDNVYLSFFYQAGGFGNLPEPEDSLILEFYAPGTDAWLRKWSTPGIPSGDFQQVFVHVDQSFFLVNGFRFRFRNYATISGNADHWHIDYVRINTQVNPNNNPISDIAFVYNIRSMLNDYTAMPWRHFKVSPLAFMAPSADIVIRNLSPAFQNIPISYNVSYDGQVVSSFPNVNVQPATAPGIYSGTIPANSPPSNFVYNTSLNDTCAVFDIRVFFNSQDAFPQNDTIRFRQEFLDYFAYDDGTAERAYGLLSANAQLAVRFQATVPDVLYGLKIYFDPFTDDVSSKVFNLRAWTDNNGKPGNQIGLNFIPHYPTYLQEGPDVFAYYEFDEPLDIQPGIFYVGMIQQTEERLNIGNDKNGNTNTSKVFYKLNPNANWLQTTIQGSLMIRPVMASCGGSFVGVTEAELEAPVLYPNPFTSSFEIKGLLVGTHIQIFDMAGRVVFSDVAKSDTHRLDLSSVPNGFYLANMVTPEGRTATVKVIKSN